MPAVVGCSYSPVWLDEEVRGQAEGSVAVSRGGDPPARMGLQIMRYTRGLNEAVHAFG
jgi:hypothetical protein